MLIQAMVIQIHIKGHLILSIVHLVMAQFIDFKSVKGQ